MLKRTIPKNFSCDGICQTCPLHDNKTPIFCEIEEHVDMGKDTTVMILEDDEYIFPMSDLADILKYEDAANDGLYKHLILRVKR
jgi:hypothetical protein